VRVLARSKLHAPTLAPQRREHKQFAAKPEAADAPPSQQPKGRREYLVSSASGRLREGVLQIDFIQEVAAKSGLSMASVRKLLAALKPTVIGQLRKKGCCRLAGMCRLKIKTMPPREGRTQAGLGKVIHIKARPQPTTKITVITLKPLRHVLEQ